MITTTLGNSDLSITRFGLGAWAIGGDWKFGWSTQDDTDSISAIHQALELGINWIDTAAVYGLGHSEEIVARALASWSGAQPYVFTKCGMVWNESRDVDYSTRRESIRRECEASLRRLKVEVIDLYQIHWPADDLEETLEGWAALNELKQEGKIRWAGVSNFSRDELAAASEIARITSLQPPYSLVKRAVEGSELPFCHQHQIGAIVYSPMGSGLLTGAMTRERAAALPENDWRHKNPEFQEPKLSSNLALAERVKKVAADHNVPPGAVAAAWTLHNPAVTGAIIGVRSGKQAAELFSHADFVLTPEESAFLTS
ncbi:predicted oxidoreductase [Terrimicrobium sacchariphilum]|uniref:Predicted oxidoreductase n=1 Tax=Terrimicrobium sacchariphilum TaxID=690879 RepID=A0A146GB97_TERSA|nr:aldo/keto reductase [Terrimicrobium sacchariphilum]GAT33858.1 predicted oxidoreductase [Terrimicrobium sacchariphilum]